MLRNIYGVRDLDARATKADINYHSRNGLDTAETTQMRGISPRTLEGMQLYGTGPKYVKMGQTKRAKVIYSLKDVEEWIGRHTKVGTSAV
jgi:predicted DNA-binding transcriptional regulator AlpA